MVRITTSRAIWYVPRPAVQPGTYHDQPCNLVRTTTSRAIWYVPRPAVQPGTYHDQSYDLLHIYDVPCTREKHLLTHKNKMVKTQAWGAVFAVYVTSVPHCAVHTAGMLQDLLPA